MEEDYLKEVQTQKKQSLGSHLIEFIQTLVIFAAIASAIYLFIAQPHKVSGASMDPNFKNGQYIITDKLTYRFHEPKRGEVVVFKNPKDISQDFIKRIIGIPSDRVEVLGGSIFINGKKLNEPFLAEGISTRSGFFLKEGEEVIVEKDNYIVLGDNRSNSSDSREWGFIEKNEIIGRVIIRYWPQDVIGLFPANYEITP